MGFRVLTFLTCAAGAPERNGSALLLLLCLAAVGCGGKKSAVYAPDEQGRNDARDHGQSLTPSPEERELLSQLGDLPKEERLQVGGKDYVVGPPYPAASGRTCRVVRVAANRKQQERLACATGGQWFWVPNVFAAE